MYIYVCIYTHIYIYMYHIYLQCMLNIINMKKRRVLNAVKNTLPVEVMSDTRGGMKIHCSIQTHNKHHEGSPYCPV